MIEEVKKERADLEGLDFEIDPTEPEKEEEEEEPEYKPFERRLQEMDLWKILIRNTLAALFCTFFDFFNFDIYAPLLIFYFFFITCLLCRVKIEHMIRYQYIPFNFGGK